MTITIYWSECAIEHRRYCIRWAEYAFQPLPFVAARTESGARRMRLHSIGVPVKVPVGSKIVKRGSEERLSVYWDQYGVTAETVARLAKFERKGFKIDGTRNQDTMV